MVRHGLKHIFQKPTPDIDSSDRTQQLRSKTVYAGTVNLAQTLAQGNNQIYKTYNGPYEVANRFGNANLIASRSYDDLLSITKGKVLLNQLPLNSNSRDYYQKNFAKGQMYEGNYNQFDPSHNFVGHTGCNNSVLVYDIGTAGFTGPASYDANGGFIGATGSQDNNKRIFIDPNHCFYSDPCLLDASYTRFVTPVLPAGITGRFNAQQIISADQYRGFSYPMSNFDLTCKQQLPDQAIGPLFCPPPPIYITHVEWEYANSLTVSLQDHVFPAYNGLPHDIIIRSVVPAEATYTISGNSRATNSFDRAQLILTGTGRFVGSFVSPSITVTKATFDVTWYFGYLPLIGTSISQVYDGTPHTIYVNNVEPANATYDLSGISTVLNVTDQKAQLTATGTGHFTGSITSPYAIVTPLTITATWEWSNGIDNDWLPLTENISREFNNREFTIRLIEAFYISSGNTKIIVYQNTGYLGSGVVQRTNPGILQTSLQGIGNFTGVVFSPSIHVFLKTFLSWPSSASLAGKVDGDKAQWNPSTSNILFTTYITTTPSTNGIMNIPFPLSNRQGKFIIKNINPTIIQGGVSPMEGNTGDTFTISGIYMEDGGVTTVTIIQPPTDIYDVGVIELTITMNKVPRRIVG